MNNIPESVDCYRCGGEGVIYHHRWSEDPCGWCCGTGIAPVPLTEVDYDPR